MNDDEVLALVPEAALTCKREEWELFKKQHCRDWSKTDMATLGKARKKAIGRRYATAVRFGRGVAGLATTLQTEVLKADNWALRAENRRLRQALMVALLHNV